MASLASTERAALADLLDQLGPDAPTLCKGWATRDLAAHVVTRERRPDTAGGVRIKPLAGHTRRVQAEYAAKPWPELVAMVRQGPPSWSPLSLEPVDRVANSTEFFVHHEDVRRAQDGWAPRPRDARVEEALWASLSRGARLFYRRARTGVVLRRDNGAEVVAKRADSGVVVIGPASELVLYTFGRTQHARVEVEGDPEAVRIFRTTPLDA